MLTGPIEWVQGLRSSRAPGEILGAFSFTGSFQVAATHRRDREMTPDQILERTIPEPNSGCWLWAGRCDKWGYGRCSGRSAHRVSFETHKEAIKPGNVIRHSCDQPSCVNPDHLLEGTQADNIQDRARRKRGDDRRGERNQLAVLTNEVVVAIRDDWRPLKFIAEDYGITKNHASRIRLGKRWPHVIGNGR